MPTPYPSDDEIDVFIDGMLNNFEKEGKSYDQCLTAMENTIVSTNTPLSISEWVEQSQVDKKKRRKFSEDVFTPEAVKTVITKLMRQKRIVRIGQQTFCPITVVHMMGGVIDKVLERSSSSLTIEEIAEQLLSQKDKQKKYPSQSDLTFSTIKNFIEEKVIRLAIAGSNTIAECNEDYVCQYLIQSCADLTADIIKGRTFDFEHWEFFDFVARVNPVAFFNDYNMKIALQDEAVRTLTLLELSRREAVLLQPWRVQSNNQSDQYRSLDD